ncbi:MAG: TIGR03085 family protein [Micromonosporaceae bacterium]|nr:TIGR03085 family protein [Micromonosporaceae bacterium]
MGRGAASGRYAQRERDALADLFAQVGPDAPTLCAGWTTRDLAAHLVVRATRLDAAGGIFIPALSGRLTRVQDRVAARPWDTLVAQVRRRPWWSLGPLDELANRTEYLVHHEDVRRARPGWEPRALPPDVAAALWPAVRLRARLALRRTPASVTVTAPGLPPYRAGRGGPEVVLAGEPAELLLFLFGRQAHARVDLTGPEHITARMRTARYGI